jgi:guanosine-3',5'-bis(diphosphate) 3'-pyrophosphohydrolase
MSLQALKKRFTQYNEKREDWALIRKAYQFALNAHAGQKRVSGDLFITHPLGSLIFWPILSWIWLL